MPLDFTPETLLPDHINFPVVFEPTKFDKSKYVINGDTGDYIGIVGNGFSCASHGDFFTQAHNTISEHLGAEFCDNMNINYRTARNNAWVMMDMTMPNVLRKIETEKHSTTIAPRLIALHGIDGSCSNMVFFGAIDFFCTNGMITGDYDKIKRKNTSNFSLDKFIPLSHKQMVHKRHSFVDNSTSCNQYPMVLINTHFKSISIDFLHSVTNVVLSTPI